MLSILLAHMIPEPRGRSGAGEHNESHQLVPWWYFSSELIDTSQGETRESKPPPTPPAPPAPPALVSRVRYCWPCMTS
jgi:hypothetical protein